MHGTFMVDWMNDVFFGGADVDALWLFLIILLLLFLHMYENNFVGTVLIRGGNQKEYLHNSNFSHTHKL